MFQASFPGSASGRRPVSCTYIIHYRSKSINKYFIQNLSLNTLFLSKNIQYSQKASILPSGNASISPGCLRSPTDRDSPVFPEENVPPDPFRISGVPVFLIFCAKAPANDFINSIKISKKENSLFTFTFSCASMYLVKIGNYFKFLQENTGFPDKTLI